MISNRMLPSMSTSQLEFKPAVSGFLQVGQDSDPRKKQLILNLMPNYVVLIPVGVSLQHLQA